MKKYLMAHFQKGKKIPDNGLFPGNIKTLFIMF